MDLFSEISAEFSVLYVVCYIRRRQTCITHQSGNVLSWKFSIKIIVAKSLLWKLKNLNDMKEKVGSLAMNLASFASGWFDY